MIFGNRVSFQYCHDIEHSLHIHHLQNLKNVHFHWRGLSILYKNTLQSTISHISHHQVWYCVLSLHYVQAMRVFDVRVSSSPLGCRYVKFRFCGDLHFWASPWRFSQSLTPHSLTHITYLMPRERKLSFQKNTSLSMICYISIKNFNEKGQFISRLRGATSRIRYRALMLYGPCDGINWLNGVALHIYETAGGSLNRTDMSDERDRLFW